jgi:hypothetical protein
MSHDLNDDPLRTRFAQLRDAEGTSAPRFSLPSARSAARRNFAWAAAAAALVLIGGTAWLLSQRPAAPVDQLAFDLSGTAWVAPTDFLLNTPGSELLRDVPKIGGTVTLPSPTTFDGSRTDTSTSERRLQ